MDRRHAVPRAIRDVAVQALKGEEVLLAVAANLDVQGRFVGALGFRDGPKHRRRREYGSRRDSSGFRGDEHYRAHTRTGSGFLEASRNGHTTVLARYSMEHVAQFAAVAGGAQSDQAG